MRKHVVKAKALSVLMAVGMVFSVFPTAVSAGWETSFRLEESLETDSLYGYGVMDMTYAEFYAGDVTGTDGLDAVSVATVGKMSTFTNVDAAMNENEDGYEIYGVKNVPVKVMNSASDELKERVTLNADPTAEVSQYKTVDGNGIGAMVSNVAATVTDATTTFTTGGTWGDYEIDVIESSTLYLRNTKSNTYTDSDGNEQTFAVNNGILGIILETEDGTKVGTGHMENIWVQPYKIAFSVDGCNSSSGTGTAYNKSGFETLVGKNVSTITFIMPEETYVYELADSVYIKPAYTDTLSGSFTENADGTTTFTFDQTVSELGLTNAKVAISYTVGSGRNKTVTTLLEETDLTEQSYTFTGTLPTDVITDVSITSDSHADFEATYPMFSWQKESLTSLVSQAAELLTQTESSILQAHKEEAEALLADETTTAQAADELISELTELVAEAQEALQTESSETESSETAASETATTETTQSETAASETVTTETAASETATPTEEQTETASEDAGQPAEGDTFVKSKVTYTVTKEGAEVAYTKTTATGKITVPKKVTYEGVTYKVTSVAAKAFKGNKKITSVVIGNNVTTIGANAFSGCTKLKTVTLGTGVTAIGKQAFKGCSALKKITVKSTKLKTVGKNAFKGIKATAKIKVPAKKLTDYKKLLKGKGQGSSVTITK